jgi:hypothetical protein
MQDNPVRQGMYIPDEATDYEVAEINEELRLTRSEAS